MSGTVSGRSRLAGLIVAGVVAAALLAPSGASAAGADCQIFSEPCLLPFPNNLYTKKDKKTPTGRRVNLPADAMPVNNGGTPVNPGEWNRSDGFSPGSMIVVRVPGLDNPQALANTNPASLTNLASYKEKKAPIVVIDKKTGKRQPIWAELDSHATSPENTNLLIHPAVNFREKHKYIVAMRKLKDASGNKLDAPKWFEKLRDGKKLPKAEKSQRKRYKHIFKPLKKKAKIKRKSLYEAWDFTVASRPNITDRMLSIRDDAFSQLGDNDLSNGKVEGNAPQFQVTSVDNSPSDTSLLRIVKGTFTVPCYLDQQGCTPGSAGFHYDSTKPDALPTQIPGNTGTANFDCIVPKAAQTQPARLSLYGHGLLGDAGEVESSPQRKLAEEHDIVLCASNFWGFSSDDIPSAIKALGDLNYFPADVDRLEQGGLNQLLLGRLMDNPQGLASNSNFQGLLDTSNLYWDGNSQGGILGGFTTAIAPDWTRAVLGVSGMNYGGLLLQRSTDFATYQPFLFASSGSTGYSDNSLDPLILSLMAQVWDRGEPDGYAQQMTSTALPNTPTHNVMMQIAYGDHQVSQYAATVEARTIGASAYEPALDPDRTQDQNLFYGIPAISSFPFDGSAIVIWDSGPGRVNPPPTTNLPPVTDNSVPGETDPHSDPRNTVAARNQTSAFLSNPGSLIDVCGGAPCHTDAFTP